MLQDASSVEIMNEWARWLVGWISDVLVGVVVKGIGEVLGRVEILVNGVDLRCVAGVGY